MADETKMTDAEPSLEERKVAALERIVLLLEAAVEKLEDFQREINVRLGSS